MDTLRIAGISFTNYALHLGHFNDVLQIVVALLSIDDILLDVVIQGLTKMVKKESK